MKYKTINFYLAALLTITASAWADGDHAAPKSTSRFSEKSAVTAFDPEEGFKMSDAALQTLGVRFAKIDGHGSWTVSKNALVWIKHTSGVYRRFENWISFILVEVVSKKDGSVTIRSEDLQAGDEVAVEGASFLRMTEADLNADTVDSCSH